MIIKIANILGGILILVSAKIKARISANFYEKQKRIEKTIKESLIINSFVPPSNLLLALVSIEDRRFYAHKGIDIYSILRATYKNMKSSRKIEGASTITQQLVRSITNEREINIKRKINEVLLATLVDANFTKQDILYAYLKLYSFNTESGIEQFCKRESYCLTNLSKQDATEITARFKYPTLSTSNYIRFLKRVRTITINMQ